MGSSFDIAGREWQPVRPEITQGVWGKSLLKDGVWVVLTRVAPGGKFAVHKDNYGHLFYFLSGEGVVQVGDSRVPAHAGLVVQIAPREDHAYENTGAGDLILISMNLPAADK